MFHDDWRAPFLPHDGQKCSGSNITRVKSSIEFKPNLKWAGTQICVEAASATHDP